MEISNVLPRATSWSIDNSSSYDNAMDVDMDIDLGGADPDVNTLEDEAMIIVRDLRGLKKVHDKR